MVEPVARTGSASLTANDPANATFTSCPSGDGPQFGIRKLGPPLRRVDQQRIRPGGGRCLARRLEPVRQHLPRRVVTPHERQRTAGDQERGHDARLIAPAARPLPLLTKEDGCAGQARA
jgi:hypothetical protein